MMLAETIDPLDRLARTPAIIVGAAYEYIELRLQQACRTTMLMPDNEARFLRAPQSNWPEIRRIEFPDQWRDEDPPPVREVPSARDITEMEEALAWPLAHCKAHGQTPGQLVGSIVRMAAWGKVIGVTSQYGLFLKRRKMTVGQISRRTFWRRYQDGISDIVAGLN